MALPTLGDRFPRLLIGWLAAALLLVAASTARGQTEASPSEGTQEQTTAASPSETGADAAAEAAAPGPPIPRQPVEPADGRPEGLDDRWIRDLLPEPLLRIGPQGLRWWQWLGFPVVALIALAIGRVLGGITRAALHLWFSRTRTTLDERLLQRIGPALTLLWAVGAFRLLLPWLALLPEARSFVHAVLAAGVVVATFWMLWRSADVIIEVLLEHPWAVDNPSARSLLSVGGNLTKAAVAVGGVVTTIATFGYPVATMLAGLGIGGIAFAFGAQKTVENLFGSVALAADQPCRVGDFVKIEDFVGTVERIGSRSTRIRTLDRTLITIPNGRLSDMRIESFAVRDRIRLSITIGVVYDTTEAQMQGILSGMGQVLRAHPKIWPDTVVVRFAGFGACSLDIEVMCWFQTTDYNEFRDCRQDVLLGFMKVVEEAGSTFAFPTRSVHLVSGPPPAATQRASPEPVEGPPAASVPVSGDSAR